MTQPFSGTTSEDILSFLAYHPQDLDIWGISTPTRRPVVKLAFRRNHATLGCLDGLPIELLDIILRYTDLHAVAMLRLVNRQARAVVDASVPYKHLVLHAPGVVAVLAETKVASHFTVEQVFDVLSTPSCRLCDNFGTFLCIPECIRCCITCLRERPELMPIGERDAKAAFGLTKKMLATVPVMNTLPGEYIFGLAYRRKRYLVSWRLARDAALRVHGGEEGLARNMCGRSRAKVTYDNPQAHSIRDHITRFMAVVALPYFDPNSRKTHDGLSCQGCQYLFERRSDQVIITATQEKGIFQLLNQRDRTFTEEGIFQHFEKCAGARALWTAHRDSDFPSDGQ